MKKVLLLFILPLLFLLSCNETAKKEAAATVEEKSIPTSITLENPPITVNIFEQTPNRIRLKSSEFLSKENIQLVVDSLFLDEIPTYFYLSSLTESGGEYAFRVGSEIIIYDNPPKTKEDIEIINLNAEISLFSTNLDLLSKGDIVFSDIASIRTQLDDCVNLYKKLQNTNIDNSKLKSATAKYKSKLISTQKNIFPRMRKAFAESSKNNLWEHNVNVKYSGTTISFIGYLYASNKNIKESYEAIADLLAKLRFKRINFKWSESAEYTYYTISSLNDGDIE